VKAHGKLIKTYGTLFNSTLLNGRATLSGRAAQADHKNAARPEGVALPNENRLKYNKVDLKKFLP
jgi:hypothetical protein